MSIFDGLTPELIAGLLSISNGGLDLTLSGQTQQPNLWDLPSNEELMMQDEEEEIKKPKMPNAMRDISGFANYGMQAPALPDPMQRMSGLMGMMNDQNQAPKQRMPLQQNSLMSYLQSLGG